MGQPDEEHYSPEEALAVFRNLSEVELDKLGRIASFIAGSGGYPGGARTR
ncbi:hypothetical protein LJR098_004474 [Rhizobium sp. LjRoot98]|nr:MULTISPECIES: hypothetical protein [unclassified Rhizobium]